MRSIVALALATALAVAPTTVIGQGTETEPGASPGQSETSSAVAYACISYDPTPNGDVALAILAGQFEVVSSSMCSLVGVAEDFTPVKEDGRGSKRSKPFVLSAGDYEVTISWGNGCRPSKDFPDPGNMYLNLIGSDEGGVDFDQSTYAYDLDAGRYYMKINTNTEEKCKWAFIVSPFEE